MGIVQLSRSRPEEQLGCNPRGGVFPVLLRHVRDSNAGSLIDEFVLQVTLVQYGLAKERVALEKLSEDFANRKSTRLNAYMRQSARANDQERLTLWVARLAASTKSSVIVVCLAWWSELRTTGIEHAATIRSE